MPALAMTDHNSVAAAVKFVEACRGYGIKPILGTEITIDDESHLTLLAPDRASYAELCRLLSAAYAAGGRLAPRLAWAGVRREAWGVSDGAPQPPILGSRSVRDAGLPPLLGAGGRQGDVTAGCS